MFIQSIKTSKTVPLEVIRNYFVVTLLIESNLLFFKTSYQKVRANLDQNCVLEVFSNCIIF